MKEYTEKEIANLQAGEELDAIIAELRMEPPMKAYSTSIDDAWELAEELGLALVPQSAEGGTFHWLAMDIYLVRYRGDETVLQERAETGFSAPTAPLAICRSYIAAKQTL